MLVALRELEIEIEPVNIFIQAIRDGELTMSDIVNISHDEEGEESLLDEIDNDAIKAYCKEYDLNIELNSYEQVSRAIDDFTQQDKALLLWQLLRCEG